LRRQTREVTRLNAESRPSPAVHRLYLEIGAADGWCLVHSPDLPGVGFKAVSREAALALAPGALLAELDWARRAGVGEMSGPVAVAGEVTLDVPAAAGDTEATFEPDLEPLDDPYLGFALRYLDASRAALLGLIGRLPSRYLDWRAAEGKRTLGEVLGHISDADAFYLVRLEDQAEAGRDLWPRYAGRDLGLGPVERACRTRVLALERLGRLTPADRRRIVERDPHAETWTARKVLRRLVWHERYHTRQIEDYLTTAETPGAPRA